ncbi:OmpA family protein [Nocardiopsis composta]|uniref:Outer membrane protein OmpA-like peptidoglycan-associated protein n=1 Tax=Nocardiopsis composta TaxID=157465 RepID=A0A7W8QKW4_9ACTN|nr:OmpA family protein [Nocardiopsis composta]MBB5432332.1 outer membrane protein OmpA-like peptidoglycan-associated protein [Nocardiopsis composta]
MRRSAIKRLREHRLAPVVPLLAVSLLLSSCVSGGGDSGGGGGDDSQGGGGDGSSGSGSENKPIATSLTSATAHKENLEFGVMSLERHGDDMVVLNVTVTNRGDKTMTVRDMFREAGRFDGIDYTPDGVSLVDTANSKRYMPFNREGEDKCLCSDWDGTTEITEGESIDFWVAYPNLPSEVKSVVITTPVTPNIIDVPITNTKSPDKEITETPVEDPDIRDLTSYADALDGESSREETGSETKIMLSSDILFKVNESKLTEKATQALESVAKEIDASSGSTVKIDGYTDNTGNDSINNPLSEERAEAVKKELEKITTREGLEFEVEGHGSDDPVATNSTDEGREKNRRVTITFEK